MTRHPPPPRPTLSHPVYVLMVVNIYSLFMLQDILDPVVIPFGLYVPMASFEESYGTSITFSESDDDSYTGDDADNDDDTNDQYPSDHHCLRKSTEAEDVGM